MLEARLVQEGIYEQLINRELEGKLNQIENSLIVKGLLDEEETLLVLSSYIKEVVKKALVFMREDKRRNRAKKRMRLVLQLRISDPQICQRL